MKTGEKTLVESSYDNIWGTGIPLSNGNCLVKEQWEIHWDTGKNANEHKRQYCQ